MSKKYTFMIFFFIVGLIFISIIKNETRKLQKEINNLKIMGFIKEMENLRVDSMYCLQKDFFKYNFY